MSEENGLLTNPNEEIEQQKQVTLTDIKEDTGAIRDVLTKFGGAEIEQAKNLEKIAKVQRKQAEDKSIAKAIEQGVIAAVKQSTPKFKPETKPKVERKEKAPKVKQKTAQKNNLKPEHKSDVKQQPPKISTDDPKRDKSGRFIGSKKNSDEEATENDARVRKILDALDGVKESVEDLENIDPMVNVAKELKAPLGAIWKIGSTSTKMLGRGFGWIFSSNKAENKEQSRFFSFFRKSKKHEDKQQSRIVTWLSRIWKKDTARGLLGMLGVVLMFIPRLLGGLFTRLLSGRIASMAMRGFMGSLFRGIGGAFGKLFKSGKGLLGGLFGKGINLSKGLLGGIGKLSKGLLRRVPLLGSLLAIGDGIGGLFDDSRDENGQSNRGKRVGGAIGAIAGGALGSLVGPIGTVVGAMIGDIVGEKIGAWLADVDWSQVGAKITAAWDATTKWFVDGWNNTITPAWNATTDWMSKKWESATKSFTEIWDSIKNWFADLMPEWLKNGATAVIDTVKDVGGNAFNAGKEWVGEKAQQAKEWANEKVQSVKNWYNETNFTEKATQIWSNVTDSVSNWFSDEDENTENTETNTVNTENVNNDVSTHKLTENNVHNEEIINQNKTSIEQQTTSNEHLGKISTTLTDILAVLKEKLSALFIDGTHTNVNYAVNEWGVPNQSASSMAMGLASTAISVSKAKPTKEKIELANTLMSELNKTGWSQTEKNHFLAQVSHESNDLTWTEELASGAAYEERADLGNTQAGDGVKFKGRGIIQTTGRANYQALADYLGRQDIMSDPSIVAKDPQLAVQSAIFWWEKKKKESANFRAAVENENAVETVSRGVNGGTNGLQDRIRRYNDIKAGRGTILSYVSHSMENNTPDNTQVSSNAQNQTMLTTASFPAITQGMKAVEFSQAIPTVKTAEPPNYVALSQEVEKSAPKLSAQNSSTTQIVQNNQADPIFQFLTQDVSERRIAHIVTGGLLRSGRQL